MTRLIVLLVLTTTCAATPAGLPFGRPECADKGSDRFFFPEGSIGARLPHFDEDEFVRRWYSKHLRAMSEPTLSCKEPAGEAYRLVWLPTFGHPIAVRVDRLGSDAVISGVELDGHGGYEPGKTIRNTHRNLTPAESSKVAQGLEGIGFWNLPTKLPDSGNDGEQWIVEGRQGFRYHVVDRWSPKDGPYRSFCTSLLELAGLATPEKDEWSGKAFGRRGNE